MTNLLIHLLNLPPKTQRRSAVVILCIIVTMGVSGTWLLSDVLVTKLDMIQDMRRQLFRLHQLVESRPAPAFPIDAYPSDLFLAGSSEATVQAKLQEKISELATASNVTIASLTGVPAREIEVVRYVGLRADAQGNYAAVLEFIRQIESAMPPLVITTVSLRGNLRSATEDVLAEPPISVDITILAPVDPTVAAMQEASS
ncbi:hypothetical protein BJF93_08040 [Xaviernesmea oryzae]|uniref:General secretion pathway protein M n=1 Tax=Xaviernesmea oryzae TaxID=464029 RepID=A0A1Q9AWA6_9HYPH|nr:type II secretion system protein GspM [Xaviernesmea oryzae]OLP59710.1 hypothetical protein BJF93_08040 [Xaviernesmea oryzae]SEM35787.1 Type II secretion system (T2SS), protein M subtype b [Xaviernesmea oryzae]